MHQCCTQQARFDQRRVWQVNRFTVNGHGMAPRTNRLDLHLCCMLFGHYLTSVVELQKHFSSIIFLCNHYSLHLSPFWTISQCVTAGHMHACCEEITICWLAATLRELASCVIIAHKLHKCCRHDMSSWIAVWPIASSDM